jgi:hypothetical protein
MGLFLSRNLLEAPFLCLSFGHSSIAQYTPYPFRRSFQLPIIIFSQMLSLILAFSSPFAQDDVGNTSSCRH